MVTPPEPVDPVVEALKKYYKARCMWASGVLSVLAAIAALVFHDATVALVLVAISITAFGVAYTSD